MLKFLPLFFASLRRKPIRTGLTIASIVVAFLLFGLFKTMQGALAIAADLAGIDRLATMHKMSLIQQFPLSYLNRIRGVDGVVAATSFIWFGGIYQDERNQLSALTTEPASFVDVYPEYALPPEQRADWIADRASMIVGRVVAERFGWQVGDTIPMRSSFYRKADGGDVWDLRLAGIYDASNGDNSSLYLHYDYLNESLGPNGARDSIGFVILKIRESRRRRRKSRRRIDSLFSNSPAETKTVDRARGRSGLRESDGRHRDDRHGRRDAPCSSRCCSSAGNTMAQSVRERINEIAVLEDARRFRSASFAGPRADRVVR